MSTWLRCAVNFALPAALAACLGVQPGEIAWPGSRIWESPPAEASSATARDSADLPGTDLAREIERAQGRAPLPERPVLAEARPKPQGASEDSSRSMLEASPAAGPPALRVIGGTALVPPGGGPALAAEHEYQLYFAPGSSDLDEPALRVLHQLIGDALLLRPGRILVVGHADRSGSAGLNQNLSRKRAQAVAARLRDAGVPRESIVVRAFGEERLAVPSGDGAPDPGNRRVAVRLL